MGVRLGLAGEREAADAEDALAVLTAVEELVDVVIDSFAARDVDASDLSDETDWKGVVNGSRVPQNVTYNYRSSFLLFWVSMIANRVGRV